ncbi:MAG: aconitate hydratase AcnA [Candidatus Helarchaeota archaeon]
MRSNLDPFQAKKILDFKGKKIIIYSLDKLKELGIADPTHFPKTIKILLETVLRQVDGKYITKEMVEKLANWNPRGDSDIEIPFIPARVVLQDFTGVPAVVDLAAMRSAILRFGRDPSEINPLVHADLVIDHSIQVDYYGSSNARELNEQKEFERNRERYVLLRWAQNAFSNFEVVPPGRGIIHQVNLENLASVVQLRETDGSLVAFPDSCLGTDSHTTMINGLGILGWGVGGIEAEAVMLGQPYYMPVPDVIGVKLYGKLKEGVTATDLVLTVTEMLRSYGVVGKFVEFYGPGIRNLSLPDRATVSNMSPEYGATCGFFPVDEKTLDYLLLSGRSKEQVELVKVYCKEQGLFLSENTPEPTFTDTLELDLGKIKPSIAGYKRPQDRIPLNIMAKKFHETLNKNFAKKNNNKDKFKTLTDGSVVIAAITSCTNTSNPAVLIAAGLLAKKAVGLGLYSKKWVKTSLAPGSRVVIDYLQASGLLTYLEKLGFYLVGFGCTTCIGNSGPLDEDIIKQIKVNDLIVASVSSGNRNFEGRINPYTKINYLASPPLVVAYAIAGTIDIDFENEAIGHDINSNPVYLRDIWPKNEEIKQLMNKNVKPEMFEKEYSKIFEGTSLWKKLETPKGKIYGWDTKSTYIREPPFFFDFPLNPPAVENIIGARLLVLLGDSITTDHISPAGAIPIKDPAGKYLISHGLKPEDFNSFGSRRGNHEVMIRGTFGNIRLRNKLVSGREGNWTKYFPTGEEMSIYDAAVRYIKNKIPLIVMAGKEYGTGSSRDWAAKGTQLLGVKAVIAESYERIHRSNLVGMGVLPLQFMNGENAEVLKIKGNEIFNIEGISGMKPGSEAKIKAKDVSGNEQSFKAIIRLDTPIEIEYYCNGGILHTVLRNMIKNG